MAEEGERNVNFELALSNLKAGALVRRRSWATHVEYHRPFIFHVPGSTFTVNRPPLLGIYPEGTVIRYHGHVDMRTRDGYVVPWLCSQSDLLAEDWEIVSDEDSKASG
jgi:Protein of unknown function (DUF2829)